MGIHWTELIVVAFVALLIFGPKRLPEMGRQLGKGMREFKESVSGKDEPDEMDDDDYSAPVPAALPEAGTDVTASSETAARERDTVS